ncbi:WXG100 family type VII secretion target [Amycolatopsis sp. cmx-11-12]|uniref:WXG100 family type VII secretion target n=1 Tax=Amycolatopsis sp. cmx-11-12 TaxID=2785795 RepID=UPI0039182C11
MSNFQKSDSGMKGGITAIEACETECKTIHGGVAAVRADLQKDWQGAASQTFLTQLDTWEGEYLQVLRLLTEIKEMVNASDIQMNNSEEDINLSALTSFGDGGGVGGGIYKALT